MAKYKYGNFFQGKDKIIIDANTKESEIKSFVSKHPELKNTIVLEDDNDNKKSTKSAKTKRK